MTRMDTTVALWVMFIVLLIATLLHDAQQYGLL
jgi:hypothetical protein